MTQIFPCLNLRLSASSADNAVLWFQGSSVGVSLRTSTVPVMVSGGRVLLGFLASPQRGLLTRTHVNVARKMMWLIRIAVAQAKVEYAGTLFHPVLFTVRREWSILQTQTIPGPDRGVIMPTILVMLGWRLFFYANEGAEPIHVHCRKGGMECKYWIDTEGFDIDEAYSFGLNPRDKREIRKIIFQNFDYIVAQWQAFQSRK